MMKAIITIFILIVAGVAAYRYLDARAAVSGPAQGGEMVFDFGEQTYRCEDGTEFTAFFKQDMQDILILPVSDVERIKETILSKEASAAGTLYQGGGMSFRGQGESARLITSEFSVACSPISGPDTPPFNWGD